MTAFCDKRYNRILIRKNHGNLGIFSVSPERIIFSSPEKIAIIITGWSKYFGSDKYFYENPYLSDELTELIIEKNIKGIAIDTCSVDKYRKDTNHKKLLENNVWIVENITNCDNLNKTSYSSFFIPLNIEAEASPVRAFLKKD